MRSGGERLIIAIAKPASAGSVNWSILCLSRCPKIQGGGESGGGEGVGAHVTEHSEAIVWCTPLGSDQSSPLLATSLAKCSAVIAHRLAAPPSSLKMTWCSTPSHSAEPNATAIEANTLGVSTLRPLWSAASASPSCCLPPPSSSKASAVGVTRSAGGGTSPRTGTAPPQSTKTANTP